MRDQNNQILIPTLFRRDGSFLLRVLPILCQAPENSTHTLGRPIVVSREFVSKGGRVSERWSRLWRSMRRGGSCGCTVGQSGRFS